MAVGDLVSAAYHNAASPTTFRPASGVQICITQFIADGESSESRIYGLGNIDTVSTTARTLCTSNESAASGTYYGAQWAGQNHKFFIDNASYLSFYSANTTHSAGFSGIQTQ
jgi:hypothetical protein